MFQSWRRKLRQAEAAYRAGQLEEASRLLTQEDLKSFLPAQQLAARVAKGLIERARRDVEEGNSLAGWRDLASAEPLRAETESADNVRLLLVDRAVADIEATLAAGRPLVALVRLEALECRGELSSKARTLRQVAQMMAEAEGLARRGKFAAAEMCVAAAESLAPHIKRLVELRAAYRRHMAEGRSWYMKLHRAMHEEDWTAALEAAEALLAVAPENGPALAARQRAWQAVGVTLSQAGRSARAANGRFGHGGRISPPARTTDPTRSGVHSAKVDTVSDQPSETRFVLWIDAVGGFLVCLGQRVVLGQPCGDRELDVPILGDLSRHHAVIYRDEENYLLEAIQPVRLAGRPVAGLTSLADGQIIELGRSVRIRFRRPHALSVTARLEMLSHHKTLPPADGVLLMGESCVLGPSADSHVVCRDWSRQVVLFRQGTSLSCRAEGSFQIDHRPCEGVGELTTHSHVEGEDFSLSLEPVA